MSRSKHNLHSFCLLLSAQLDRQLEMAPGFALFVVIVDLLQYPFGLWFMFGWRMSVSMATICICIHYTCTHTANHINNMHINMDICWCCPSAVLLLLFLFCCRHEKNTCVHLASIHTICTRAGTLDSDLSLSSFHYYTHFAHDMRSDVWTCVCVCVCASHARLLLCALCLCASRHSRHCCT